MSDTPRCDAVYVRLALTDPALGNAQIVHWVRADVARQLEREVNALQSEVNALKHDIKRHVSIAASETRQTETSTTEGVLAALAVTPLGPCLAEDSETNDRLRALAARAVIVCRDRDGECPNPAKCRAEGCAWKLNPA